MDTYFTSNNITTGSIYDVSTYSDRELYDILDLDNPTDRELEAKILTMVNKYTRTGNLSSDMLAQFFIDIYTRFFEVPEDNSEYNTENEEDQDTDTDTDTDTYYEGFETTQSGNGRSYNIDGTPNQLTYLNDPPTEISDMRRTYDFTNYMGNVNIQPLITKTFNTQKINRVGTLDITKNNRGESSTQLTKQIDYTKDFINPLLKETIKRVISIDSQYRDNKDASPTEFTFNLSEPLKDVVSLKLYSIHIPRSWYTVSSSFGGNFFYIKGDVEGIDNGNHDYKIEIVSGNYDENAENLVNAVNESIQKLSISTPHVDFGNTSISYGAYDALTTLKIDVKESFGESNYYLEFPNWSSPLNIDSRANTLAGYLGFNTTKYDCFSIYSDRTILTTQLKNENNSLQIDASNNTITIVNYIPNTNTGVYEYQPDPTTQIHDSSFSIVITTGQYNIYSLLAEINTQLSKNDAFDTEYSRIQPIDIDHTSEAQTALSYIKMDIKFKRKILQNKENIKTAILFPVIPPNGINLWKDSLKFSQAVYETSHIRSETQIKQSRYVIQNGVLGNTGIKFVCNVPGYIDSTNDIVIYLSNSNTLGYTLDEYVNEINRTIGAYRDPKSNKSIAGTKIEKTSDHYLKINPVVNVSFTNKDYKIKVEGQNLPKILFNEDTEATYNLGDNYNWEVSFDKNNVTKIDSSDILHIIPIFTYAANPDPPQTFTIQLYTETIGAPFKTFSTVDMLIEYINKAFLDYRDAQNSNPFLNGYSYTKLSKINEVTYKFTVGIIKSFITDDYLLSLYGEQQETINSIITNPWVTYLDFSGKNNNVDLPYDEIYVLKNINKEMGNNILNNSPITNNQITLTNNNNYFYIKSYSNIDGLTKNGTGLYDIKITIPVENTSEIYTIEDIYSITNNLFDNSFNGIAKGSTVGKDSDGYTVFKININKVFRTNDYRLVFYDPYSFVSCYSGATRKGAKSVQNATWDTTLGWVLGFRNQIIYYLNELTTYSIVNGNPVYTLVGDTTVSTSIYNYFLIMLDDYTQNHLNDGLVTITPQETNIDVGPYKYVCDPYFTNGSELQIAVPADKDYTQMTQRDLYVFNQKILSNKIKEKSYSKGPFVKDIFGIIPIKHGGFNTVYTEFGGTLQNQERMYFGPVNIRRMTIRLLNDRGDLVDLNNSNWSFSLICEQLYKQAT